MTYNHIYNLDSRKISETLDKHFRIQTTITSPPYYDMKDYGVEGQVGYGQKYEDYLEDLKSIFKQVFHQTKDDGTLWIIIDTFKRNHNIVPLPFDLTAKLQQVGWLLQDIIIWKKDKTVPWSNNGFTQRKFEYILLFSKSPKFKNNKDRIRLYDTRQLKKWWVKYPERYNPRGKALDEIWEYPIPVQGSWGDKYIRHFCPLPKDMVSNMIQISTDEGDLVFDPFAGTGTVLSQSAYMNRKYVGFELNPSYINQFESYLQNTLESGKSDYAKLIENQGQNEFEETILNLRALKYGRLLVKKLQEETGIQVKVFVERLSMNLNRQAVKYTFLFIEKELAEPIISEAIKKTPLSKFEIDPIFEYNDSTPDTGEMFFYSITNSYSYMRDVTVNSPRTKVISSIKVDLKESDYE